MIAEARIFNVGLHFDTRAAAESRIAYLREENPAAKCRIFTCELALENSLRVDDIFGHTYGWTFDILEINKEMPVLATERRKVKNHARKAMFLV